MTPQQIRLVRSTFARLEGNPDRLGHLFYAQLFALDPTLLKLFAHADMDAQQKKLMSMLGLAVHSLETIGGLVPVLRELGARHVGYGVTPRHYDLVGASLLWTLEQLLDEAFTREVKLAWIAAYTLLSTTMIEGANRKAAA
ncbi:globin family protein [Sphingomicrobium arenosum]|uniref:globin family protein n=1 Tax=Sphingomicrobium arenosum TaxID=2233861 RepID=UPI0022405206|nr:globin family protein [Sphingomicrobium arenosum]